MKKLFGLLTLFSIVFITVYAAGNIDDQDKVTLEIIEDGKVRRVSFDWPFQGPPPVGSDSSLVATVDTILKDNDVDCPPERTKVSEHVWKCGNGKLIRTDNRKLGRLLSKAWDD